MLCTKFQLNITKIIMIHNSQLCQWSRIRFFRSKFNFVPKINIAKFQLFNWIDNQIKRQKKMVVNKMLFAHRNKWIAVVINSVLFAMKKSLEKKNWKQESKCQTKSEEKERERSKETLHRQHDAWLNCDKWLKNEYQWKPIAINGDYRTAVTTHCQRRSLHRRKKKIKNYLITM